MEYTVRVRPIRKGYVAIISDGAISYKKMHKGFGEEATHNGI